MRKEDRGQGGLIVLHFRPSGRSNRPNDVPVKVGPEGEAKGGYDLASSVFSFSFSQCEGRVESYRFHQEVPREVEWDFLTGSSLDQRDRWRICTAGDKRCTEYHQPLQKSPSYFRRNFSAFLKPRIHSIQSLQYSLPFQFVVFLAAIRVYD